MATPGELVKIVAASTGEDEATVSLHDRNLVIAGLRTKGGRGRSAAKVTARDAACLLTSVLGSHRVKDSIETVRRYMQTQENRAYWHQYYPEDRKGAGPANVWEHFGIPELTKLPSDHSFIDALTVLIELAAEGRLPSEVGIFSPIDGITIIVTWPRTHARISMDRFKHKGDRKHVQADYQSNEPPRKANEKAEKETIDPRLLRSTEMKALPILYVGALLAGKIDELLPLSVEPSK